MIHSPINEAVRVEFDPNVVSYEKLLSVFWSVHDPNVVSVNMPVPNLQRIFDSTSTSLS